VETSPLESLVPDLQLDVLNMLHVTVEVLANILTEDENTRPGSRGR
jgi:hypothetical protein